MREREKERNKERNRQTDRQTDMYSRVGWKTQRKEREFTWTES